MRAEPTPFHASAMDTDDGATFATIDLVGAALMQGIRSILERHEAEIAALQAAHDVRQEAIVFSRLRPSWTVRQLADDLSMNEQTIRNYLALPEGHPQRLASFQPSKGAPHRILPEMVADWLNKTQNRAA